MSISGAFPQGVNEDKLYQVGDIAATARSSFKPGWLKCNGAAYTRTQLSGLYSILYSHHDYCSVDMLTRNVTQSKGTQVNGDSKIACSDTIIAVLNRYTNRNDTILFTSNNEDFSLIDLGKSNVHVLFAYEAPYWYLVEYDYENDKNINLKYTTNLAGNSWTTVNVSTSTSNVPASMCINGSTIAILTCSGSSVWIYYGSRTGSFSSLYNLKTTSGKTIACNYGHNSYLSIRYGKYNSSTYRWAISLFADSNVAGSGTGCAIFTNTSLSTSGWDVLYFDGDHYRNPLGLEYCEGVWGYTERSISGESLSTFYITDDYLSSLANGPNRSMVNSVEESFKRYPGTSLWIAAGVSGKYYKISSTGQPANTSSYTAKLLENMIHAICSKNGDLAFVCPSTGIYVSDCILRVPNITIDKSTAWIKAT